MGFSASRGVRRGIAESFGGQGRIASISSGHGTGFGTIKVFDRRDYGLEGNIPFIKIADRVGLTTAA